MNYLVVMWDCGSFIGRTDSLGEAKAWILDDELDGHITNMDTGVAFRYNMEIAEKDSKAIGQNIAFEDIEQGDRIKTVRVFDGDFILSMEGIAERLERSNDGRQCWRSGRTHAVAPEDGGPLAIDQFHILLERH